MEQRVFHGIIEQERMLFGEIVPGVPAIISEEGFLSTLLKPSDHQHHGYSTASLQQITGRLAMLGERWNVQFEILITEREPMELLHAYYAQLFHIFRKFQGLDSFRNYIQSGTSDVPSKDLGFHYLKPGVVSNAFRERFGEEHVFTISMSDLFSPGKIHMNRWHPRLQDLELKESHVENRRTVAKKVKMAHFRPIWDKKASFKTFDFLRDVRWNYRIKYSDHDKLEVPIIITDEELGRLNEFFNRAPK